MRGARPISSQKLRDFWHTLFWYRHIICHIERPTYPHFIFFIFSQVQSLDIASILPASVALEIVLH